MEDCKSGNCVNSALFYTLKDTSTYSCDHPCTCRFTTERSDKDKMLYNWFVDNRPMDLPSGNQDLRTPSIYGCGK